MIPKRTDNPTPKRKPILCPSVKFAIFDGDKKISRAQLQEVKAFVSDLGKKKNEQNQGYFGAPTD